MNAKELSKKRYKSPQIIKDIVLLENSVATSSATVSPGGGKGNPNPWIVGESEEMLQQEWEFYD
ncbi:hypothetical protein [Sphingobacterium sp.]|uniref:hypothetical protein n=1 Tax=Sphingobacterium sp. TaxID=341027 RepID=UPI002898D6BD|nr:hypothetical protein [Sphingobacterium sp.]